AERYSTQLLSQPQSTFEDRLHHLTILHQQTNPQFQGFLGSAQANAMGSPAKVYSIASWMTANGMSAAALMWLTNLPTKTQSSMPVPLAIGDALVAQRAWRRLEELLSGKNWEELDFVRFSWLSSAAWQLNRAQEAEAHWKMALGRTGNRLEPLRWLLTTSQ